MRKSLLTSAFALSLSALVAQDKPNIIWLMAEDMSLDLECYGMKAVKTPNLNKMAEEGIRFDNCYVTNPISSPSRSAMMTGVHQLQINAQHHRSNRDVPLQAPYKPFTYFLRNAGYTCILGNEMVMGKGRKTDCNFKHEPIGKWDGVENFGLFDKYDTFEKQDQPFFAQIQLLASHRGDWWNEVRTKSKHPVNSDSVELPLFMADHPVVRLDWAKYLDQIEFLDNEVGMLFKDLEKKGMADNTIVIFIGDNGRCNVRGKGYLYESGLNIPLIVYYPKALKSGIVRKDLVSSLDITATILKFAGAEMPKYLDGKPLFDKNFKRKAVYGARDTWDEILEKSRSLNVDKWKYIRNDMPEVPYDAHQVYLEFYRPAVHIMRKLNAEGKLNAAQKLFFEQQKPKEELYNLEKDPQELNNLACNPAYFKVLNQMRTNTLKYDKNTQSKCGVYYKEPEKGPEILNWVKTEKPELYQQMTEGVEIGFQTLTKEYNSKLKQAK